MESFTLTIRSLDLQTHQVAVTPATTVGQLYDLYAAARGTPVDLIVLICNNKPLDDDPDASLAELGIRAESRILAKFALGGCYKTDAQLLSLWQYLKRRYDQLDYKLTKTSNNQVLVISYKGEQCCKLAITNNPYELTVDDIVCRTVEEAQQLLDGGAARVVLAAVRAAAELVFGPERTIGQLLAHLHALPGGPLAEMADQHFHQK